LESFESICSFAKTRFGSFRWWLVFQLDSNCRLNLACSLLCYIQMDSYSLNLIYLFLSYIISYQANGKRLLSTVWYLDFDGSLIKNPPGTSLTLLRCDSNCFYYILKAFSKCSFFCFETCSLSFLYGSLY